MPAADPPPEAGDLLRLDDPGFHPGRVALVTGASRGVGRAVAVALAANGLTVLGLDPEHPGFDQTVRQAEALAGGRGGRVLPQAVDWRDRDTLAQAVRRAASLGSPAYLACVAGSQYIASVADCPMEAYDRLTAEMIDAPFYLCKLMIPHLKADPAGGAVGLKSSVHGHVATRDKPLYTMAKFAMRALAMSIAAEAHPRVRAFSVSTGFLQTPLAMEQVADLARRHGLPPEEVVARVMLGRSRVKRLMLPVEAANQFVWGFSRFGRGLNGADLLVDGGLVRTY